MASSFGPGATMEYLQSGIGVALYARVDTIDGKQVKAHLAVFLE